MSAMMAILIKAGLAAAAPIVAFAAHVAARLPGAPELDGIAGRRLAAALSGLLIAFALVALATTYRFDPALLVGEDGAADLARDYLAAKYVAEVGYGDLGAAVLLADRDGARRLEGKVARYRDGVTGRFRDADAAADRAGEVRARFSKTRWAELVRDVDVLTLEASPGAWQGLLLEAPHEGTPFWKLVGHAAASAVPARSFWMLRLIDALLVAAAIVAVFRAFGPIPGAVALLFVGVGFPFRLPGVGGGLLRYDWLAALLLAAAALKRERYKTAGALVGWAAAAWVFPLLFVAALIAKAVHALATHRGHPWSAPLARLKHGIPRRYWAMAAATAVTIVLCTGAGLAHGGAAQAAGWAASARALDAPEGFSTSRVGFGTAIVFDWSRGVREGRMPAGKKAEVGEKVGLRLAVAAALLIMLAFAAARLEDHEALAYGAVPFFFFAVPPLAFLGAFLLLAVAHADGIRRGGDAAALLLLLAAQFAAWVGEFTMASAYFANGLHAWALTFYSVAAFALLLLRRRDEGAA